MEIRQLRRNTYNSLRQQEKLVEFAEAHRDLALGRLRSKEARALAKRLWRKCAEILNSEGPARLPSDWNKAWNDLKCRVRGKLISQQLALKATGGGPHREIHLSELEERVANIIGRDVGAIPNVAQNQLMASPQVTQASPEAEPELELNLESIDEFNVVYNDMQLLLGSPQGSQSILQAEPSLSALVQLATSSPQQSAAPRTPAPRTPEPRTLAPRTPEPRTLAPPTPERASPEPGGDTNISSTTPQRRQARRNRSQRTGTQRNRPHASDEPAHTNRSRNALEESRQMVVRIELAKARADSMLAQAALNQSEAAKTQAEAALVAAQAEKMRVELLRGLGETFHSLVPSIKCYLEKLN